MVINEKLTARVRKALASTPRVEEKRMFRGIVFMVNEKMCVTAGDNRLMLRLDPALHDEILRKPGTSKVVMRGRDCRGFVYVNEDVLQTQKELDDWIQLALSFNPKAKSSRKKK